MHVLLFTMFRPHGLYQDCIKIYIYLKKSIYVLSVQNNVKVRFCLFFK